MILKKGQGSTEIIMIIAIGFAILGVTLALNYDVLLAGETSVSYKKLRTSVNDLSKAAVDVYRQGEGSRVKVFVTMPRSVEQFNISNSTVWARLIGRNDTVYQTFGFQVRGTLPVNEGGFYVTVESFSDAVYIFKTDSGAPVEISNLQSPLQGTTWITWTWTNPTDVDFNHVQLELDGISVGTTTEGTYNATGLLSDSDYTLTVYSVDSSGNINGSGVSNLARTIVPTVFTPRTATLRPKTCVAEDNVNTSKTFAGTCDGIYPNSCGFNLDLVGCDDAYQETHLAQRVNTTYYYGGIRTSMYDSSVLNCYNITSVRLCYEWWRDASLQNCIVQVDASGGTSYSTVSSTCPGLSGAGVVCTDVTALEPWSCNNFFGASGTWARAQSEAQRSGGLGTTIISWDVFYFNVTYNEI